MRAFALLMLLVMMLTSLLYLYPGSIEGLPSKKSFEVIAQRGVHHGYPRYLDENTCTASRIFKPTHNYIENTMESIKAALDYGATIVEIDVRPTKDHQLVVFHDDDISCRTDGDGLVWDFTLEELRQFDLGYGYTHDNGKTYPFRGKAIGKISTLAEVLQHFPDRKFLVDNKNLNDMSSSDLMVEILLSISPVQRKNIFIRAPDKAFDYMRNKVPGIIRLIEPRETQKEFFDNYIFSLGFRNFDASYANKGFALPRFMKKYIWGWPYRFLKKVSAAKARLYVFVGSKEELKQVSDIPIDGIVTYNIEQLGLGSRH